MMTSKVGELLLLRLRQIWRILSSIGGVLLIVFIIVSAGIFFHLSATILSLPAWTTWIGVLLLCLFLDLARKDKPFLKTIFSKQSSISMYVATEYIIIALPFIVFHLYFGQYQVALWTILACMFLGWLSPHIVLKAFSANKKSVSFLPLHLFELKFMVEKSPVLWMLFWCTGLLTIIHPGFFIFWLFLLALALPEMFGPFESKDMLHWKTHFVRSKIFSFIKFFSGIIAIPFLLGTIFHGEMTALLLYGVLCLYAAIALNIALKYHQYTPLYPNGRSQNISGILTMLMLLPGGVIITFSYAIWKYFSAEQNLKSLYA